MKFEIHGWHQVREEVEFQIEAENKDTALDKAHELLACMDEGATLSRLVSASYSYGVGDVVPAEESKGIQ